MANMSSCIIGIQPKLIAAMGDPREKSLPDVLEYAFPLDMAGCLWKKAHSRLGHCMEHGPLSSRSLAPMLQRVHPYVVGRSAMCHWQSAPAVGNGDYCDYVGKADSAEDAEEAAESRNLAAFLCLHHPRGRFGAMTQNLYGAVWAYRYRDTRDDRDWCFELHFVLRRAHARAYSTRHRKVNRSDRQEPSPGNRSWHHRQLPLRDPTRQTTGICRSYALNDSQSEPFVWL